MKKWEFKNGIIVTEKLFDHDLNAFIVFQNNKFLGVVLPDSIESLESCREELSNGTDPISGCWEDGSGNTCNLDGWGQAYEPGFGIMDVLDEEEEDSKHISLQDVDINGIGFTVAESEENGVIFGVWKRADGSYYVVKEASGWCYKGL